jgi:putative oxidoreductase
VQDFALLILRVVAGGFLAGHGAQKLFGSFGGPGIEGTSGFMESLGMKPGRLWAALAGLSEFGGGALTILGLLNPLGPIAIVGAMSMAALKAHSNRPIWAQEGGAELPVTNSAIAAAIALAGPGRYSLDQALGLRVPRWLVGLACLSAIVVAVAGLLAEPEQEVDGGESDSDAAANQ